MANSRTTTLIISAELKTAQAEQDLKKLGKNLESFQQKLAKTSGASMEAVTDALVKSDIKALGVLEKYQQRLAAGRAKIEAGANARREAIEKRYDARDKANSARVSEKYPLKAADVAASKAYYESKSAESLQKQQRMLQKISDSGMSASGKSAFASNVNAKYAQDLKQYRTEFAAIQGMNGESPAARKELKSLRSPDLAERRKELAAVNTMEQQRLTSLQAYVKTKKNAFKADFKEGVAAQNSVGNAQESFKLQNQQLAERKKAQIGELNERRKQQAARLAQKRSDDLRQAEVTLGSLGSGAVAAGGAFATTLLVQRAAEFEQLRQRVIQVSSSLKEAGSNMVELRKTAEYTGQSMASTVAMFARIAPAMQANNLSNQDTLDLVASFQSSLRASGTNMEQASAAAYQLSQSLSSGVLRGDELNSVIEGAPAFAKALADSIGVTIGQMKQLGEQGQLSTDVIAKAAKDARPALDAMAKNVPVTPMQQLQQAVDKLVEAMSKLDKEYQILENISKILGVVSNNADLVVKALLGMAVAAAALKAVQLGSILGKGVLALGTKSGAAGSATSAKAGSSFSKMDALSAAVDVASVAALAKRGGASAGTSAGGKGLGGFSKAVEFAGNVLMQLGKRAWPVALAFGALWAYNQVRERRDQRLVDSQAQLGKAEKENVDASASGDIFRQDRATQSLDAARKNRVNELNIRKKTGNISADELAATEEELYRLKEAELYAKKDTKNNSELRTGDVLSMRGALKLDKVRGYGGMQIGSDVAEQVKQVGTLFGLLSGSKVASQGVKAAVTLSDLAQAIEVLGTSAKSSSDITAVITALSKGLDQLTGDGFNMVNDAVQNLMDRLTKTINDEINEKIKSSSTRMAAYRDAASAVVSARSSSAVFKQSLGSAQANIADYAAGRDGTSRLAKEASERLNIQKTEEQEILKLKLSTIDSEKSAKIAALAQSTRLQLSETDASEKKTRDTVAKYIEKNTKIASDAEKRRAVLREKMGDADSAIRKAAFKEYDELFVASDKAFETAQSALYDSTKLNVPTFIGADKSKQLADLNEIKTARESIALAAGKAQQDIDRQTNKDRLDLLVEYQKSLETSIADMLKSQEDYAKKVVDLDRDMAQKRISNEKMVRDQKVSIDTDVAKMRYLRAKATGQTTEVFDASGIAIGADRQTLSDAQDRLRTAPGEVEQRKAISDIQDAAKGLLDTQLGQIKESGASEFKKLEASVRARKEYLDVVSQAVEAEKRLDMAQKDSLASAQKTLTGDLGKTLTEQGSVSAQTGLARASELASAQGDINKLRIAPEAESLASLRRSIEEALSRPFDIKFAPAATNGANAAAPVTSMQGVVINIGDRSVKAQMAPLDIQQLAQIAGGR